MQNRLRLEVEHLGVLAEVRDLDHAAPARAVVDQERLVPLATEVGRNAVHTEESRCERRDLVRGKARRRRFENVHPSDTKRGQGLSTAVSVEDLFAAHEHPHDLE